MEPSRDLRVQCGSNIQGPASGPAIPRQGLGMKISCSERDLKLVTTVQNGGAQRRHSSLIFQNIIFDIVDPRKCQIGKVVVHEVLMLARI